MSVCSLDTTIDERDEMAVASGTLMEQPPQAVLETSEPPQHDYSFRVAEYLSESVRISAPKVMKAMEWKKKWILKLYQKTRVLVKQ